MDKLKKTLDELKDAALANVFEQVTKSTADIRKKRDKEQAAQTVRQQNFPRQKQIADGKIATLEHTAKIKDGKGQLEEAGSLRSEIEEIKNNLAALTTELEQGAARLHGMNQSLQAATRQSFDAAFSELLPPVTLTVIKSLVVFLNGIKREYESFGDEHGLATRTSFYFGRLVPNPLLAENQQLCLDLGFWLGNCT